MSLFTLSDSPSVTLFPLSVSIFAEKPTSYAEWVQFLDTNNVEAIVEFRESLDDFMPNWRAVGSVLSQPISAIKQPVIWPLVSFDEGEQFAPSAPATQLTWTLNGEAVLAVDNTTLPVQIASVTNASPDHAFLRYSFSAESHIALDVQGALEHITALNLAAALAASAKGSQQVVAYFNHNASTRFYDAVCRDGAALGNLLSLDGFKDNLLTALVVKRQGELSFSSEVGVRIGLANTNKVGNVVDLDLPKAFVELEHAWSMNGAFDVLLYRPVGFDGVRLRVLKAKTEAETTNWSFDASMKFTGLTERVMQALSSLGQYPQTVSDWLQQATQLSQHFDDLVLSQLAQLSPELQRLLPTLTDSEAIDKTWVSQQLTQLLEEPVSRLTQWQKQSDEYQQLLSDTAERLFGEDSPEAVAWMRELFDRVETDVFEKINAGLSSMIDAQAENLIEQLIEPLAEVDDRFASLFDEVDVATEAFRQPFMQLLSEFQQSIQSLSNTVQQTMTDELQLVYSLRETKLRETDAIIDVSFPFYDVTTEQGQLASSLLAACLSGNFQPLLACHHSGDDALTSLFKLENSVFNTVFTSRQDSQLLINVFGWKAGRRRLFENVTKLEYTGDGVMTRAEARAITEYESGAFCLRVNSFANLLSVRDSNLVVSLRYEDDLLEHHELNRLLEQLQSQALMTKERASKIREILMDAMYLGQAKECALQLNLSVMPSELEKALRQEKVLQVAQEVALQSLSTAWERYMSAYQKRRYKMTLAVIKAYKPSHSLARNILALSKYSTVARRKKLADVANKLGISVGHSGSIRHRVNPAAKFVDYVFSMSQDFVKLVEAFKLTNSANTDISEGTSTILSKEQVNDLLAKVSANFENCFEEWVEGFGYFANIDAQQIHPGQLAFFIALMALTETPKSALNVKLLLKAETGGVKYINC